MDDEDWWVESVDELEALTGEERENLNVTLRPVSKMLNKLRKLAFAIAHCKILLPAWKSCLRNSKLPVRIMPRDVSTRWSSTCDMLGFSIKYKAAIAKLTSEHKNDLGKYELTEEEWKIAEELGEILKILKDGTEFFSRGTPNLATVIPAMDHIDKTFTESIKATSTHSAIRSALSLAKQTLNKYYSATDLSDANCIAMVLQPRYKLEYFRQAGWKDEWIDKAETIVRDEFTKLYSSSSTSGDINDDADASASVNSGDPIISQNIFDDLPAFKKRSKTMATLDELKLYLSTPPEVVLHPLRWWYEKRLVYPRLYRMALDYLSIPATSVEAKRLLSRGRGVLCGGPSFKFQSTRALLCLGSWSILGLVHDEDVMAVSRLDEVQGTIEVLG